MRKNGNGNHANGTNGGANTKGKSRRIIFKKSATKAPTAVAKAVTSDRVYYRNQYFTKGDIVSVEDVDGSVYYAQLRGFLTDQYCEKRGPWQDLRGDLCRGRRTTELGSGRILHNDGDQFEAVGFQYMWVCVRGDRKEHANLSTMQHCK